jgi:hypothetical protein
MYCLAGAFAGTTNGALAACSSPSKTGRTKYLFGRLELTVLSSKTVAVAIGCSFSLTG